MHTPARLAYSAAICFGLSTLRQDQPLASSDFFSELFNRWLQLLLVSGLAIFIDSCHRMWALEGEFALRTGCVNSRRHIVSKRLKVACTNPIDPRPSYPQG